MLKIYNIFDSKSASWLRRPVTNLAKGAAIRDLITESKDGQSPISKFPGDFTLFEVGDYDQLSGKIVMYDAPLNLGTALEWQSKEH